jgi:hypothetical protein
VELMLFSLFGYGLLAIDIPGVDTLGRFLQKKAPLYDINKALDDLWYIAMQGNLYRLVTSLGLLVAVFAVGFWCVKFYIALDEGSLRPAVNQLVWPVVIVIMLSNGGAKLRDTTMFARDTMNAINNSVNEVISAEVNLRAMYQTLTGNYELQLFIANQVSICNQIRDFSAFNQCMVTADAVVSLKQGEFGKAIDKLLPASLKSKVDPWKQSMEKFKKDALKPKTPEEAQSQSTQGANNSGSTPAAGQVANNAGNKPFNALDASTYNGSEDNLQSVVKTLLSTRTAFLYVLESMMLVTGLLGPIFVALSLFPVGTKPVIAWAVSFLSIGFCKICYNLISGLSAIAMVYAGPTNSDMTVAAVVLGLFAPVLAFVVSSNTGFSALATVNSVAQNSGFNAGFSPYNITTTDTPSTPKSSDKEDESF